MKGTVFSIEEFSIYNGVGVRTTAFLKGCPLKCSWCHNPEGQRTEPEIIKNPDGCLSCGACLDKEGYLSERGIEKCPKNLLRKCGEIYTPEKLCEKLLRNNDIFRRTGGGVTFSGGEPLFQHKFLEECLLLLKNKTNCAVQTSGFCSEEIFRRILNLADYFLYDIKIVDSKMHKKYIGASNESIINNFKILAESEKPFCVRMPLIPGVTDTEKNISETASLLAKNGVRYAELLTYNQFAGSKYRLVGREYTPNFDETKECMPHNEIWRDFGIEIKIF